MAEVSEKDPPKYDAGYARQVKDLALGVHPLAKYVPPLLLLADAVLCSLIIWKISCNSHPFDTLSYSLNSPSLSVLLYSY